MCTIKEKRNERKRPPAQAHSYALIKQQLCSAHTPNTSSPFHKPKAHYIQLEDLQEKNLDGKKETKTSEARWDYLFLYSLYTWQQSCQRHVFVLMNEFQSLHKAMIAATTPQTHPMAQGSSPTNLLPLGKSLEAPPTRENLNQQKQRENVQSGPQKTLDLGRQDCSMICLPDGVAEPTVMVFPGGAPFSPGMNQISPMTILVSRQSLFFLPCCMLSVFELYWSVGHEHRACS